MSLVRVKASAVVVGLPLLSLTACMGGGPEYSVGDCVTVEFHMTDQSLSSANCSDASSPASPIYKVDDVIKGKDGTCPPPQGFGPITFSDEPTDTTYCLTLATPQ